MGRDPYHSARGRSEQRRAHGRSIGIAQKAQTDHIEYKPTICLGLYGRDTWENQTMAVLYNIDEA
jgi:hypothetical protein